MKFNLDTHKFNMKISLADTILRYFSEQTFRYCNDCNAIVVIV